ncbi:MAG: hypothetical protein KGH98_03880 [Candidatus Micrarchaeota archaeon]|nr:hypothetical protein [Candidatus Micrarchaeota archaeon]
MKKFGDQKGQQASPRYRVDSEGRTIFLDRDLKLSDDEAGRLSFLASIRAQGRAGRFYYKPDPGNSDLIEQFYFMVFMHKKMPEITLSHESIVWSKDKIAIGYLIEYFPGIMFGELRAAENWALKPEAAAGLVNIVNALWKNDIKHGDLKEGNVLVGIEAPNRGKAIAIDAHPPSITLNYDAFYDVEEAVDLLRMLRMDAPELRGIITANAEPALAGHLLLRLRI